MPLRPPADRDSAVHFEPLRASVLDAFAELGAFDDDSGIVEWIFPEVHEQKELQRSRVKLPEVVQAPDPEPQAPPRKSRFFNIRSRSKSRSRAKKEPDPARPTPPTKLKPKKTRSSPSLREDSEKDAEMSAPPAIPPATKQSLSAEQKPRRLSIFPRKSGAQSLDQPRPSISDEEWQQITITGSIADYEINNPFLGTDPHGNNDPRPVKRDGLQGRFSRLTNTFTRSTPTSPIRGNTISPSSNPTTPTQEHAPSSLSNPTTPTPASPTSDPSTTGRTTPTGPATSTVRDSPIGPTTPTVPAPPIPTNPRHSEHSDASTSTLPAAPPSPPIQEVPRDDALETSSQMDHVRKSLSDISEGEVSESSTVSLKSSRKSQASAEDTAPPPS